MIRDTQNVTWVFPLVFWIELHFVLFVLLFTQFGLGFVENKEGYHNGDVVKHASGFPSEPGRLVIFHGGADENVHFAHTTTLISRLVEVLRFLLFGAFGVCQSFSH